MDYFNRPEVSNSDLTALKKYFIPESQVVDIESAYRFGSLIDAVITEPHRVDFFKFTVDQTQYSEEEFHLATKMKSAFLKDEFCRLILQTATTQKISIKHNFPIQHNGHKFFLNVRCKFDFFHDENPFVTGDLKSTACTTQKQFEESIEYFDYDRQAAWYMNIENRNRFMFIGVSKKNMKVFKVAIKRGDELFKRGQSKYEEIAFKYWYLFGDLNIQNYESRSQSTNPETVFEESF